MNGADYITSLNLEAPTKPRPKDTTCPKCGAGADQRVASSMGVTEPDICGRCGHAVQETT